MIIDDLSGSLLIAPPIIKTGFWSKTVIMVTEHHGHGSNGVIINKPSQVNLIDFGAQLNIPLNLPGHVHIGGPVNVRSLMMLHTSDWFSDNTLFLNQHISLSSDEMILPRLASGDVPRKWRLIMGMCAWDSGQLEQEITGAYPKDRDISWCIAGSNTHIVFGYNSTQQWTRAIDHAGLEFSQRILG